MDAKIPPAPGLDELREELEKYMAIMADFDTELYKKAMEPIETSDPDSVRQALAELVSYYALAFLRYTAAQRMYIEKKGEYYFQGKEYYAKATEIKEWRDLAVKDYKMVADFYEVLKSIFGLKVSVLQTALKSMTIEAQLAGKEEMGINGNKKEEKSSGSAEDPWDF